MIAIIPTHGHGERKTRVFDEVADAILWAVEEESALIAEGWVRVL